MRTAANPPSCKRRTAPGFLAAVVLVLTLSPALAGLTLKTGARVFPGAAVEQTGVRGKLEWFLRRYIKRQEVRLEVSEPYGDQKTYTYYLNSNSGLVVRVEFNRDMVSSDAIDKERREGPVLFTPAWRGTFTWKSKRKVEFVPTEPWKHNEVRYGLIPANVKSLDGAKLKKPFSWRLKLQHGYYVGSKLLSWLPRSGKPQVVTVFPEKSAGGDLRKDGRVFLIFDQPVKPRQIRSKVYVETADKVKRRVPIRLSSLSGKGETASIWGADVRRDHVVVLKLRKTPPGGTTIKIKFDAAMIQKDQTSSTYDWESLWQTELTIPVRLALHKMSCPESNKCKIVVGDRTTTVDNFRRSLSITFNNSLYGHSGKQLAKYVTIAPKASNIDLSVGGKTLYVSFDPDPDRTYTVSVRNLDDRAGFTLAKPLSIRIRSGDKPRNVTLRSGEALIEPTMPAHYDLKMRNIETLTLAAYPLNATTLPLAVASLNKTNLPVDDLKTPELLTIPNKGKRNYWYKHAIDLRALSTKLKSNVLLIRAMSTKPTLTDDDRFGRARYLLQLANTGLSVKLLPTGMLVWATKLNDGAPLGGARIRVFDSSGKKLLHSGTTRSDGTLLLAYQTIDPKQDLIIVSEHGQELAYSQFRYKKALRPWYFRLMDPPRKSEAKRYDTFEPHEVLGMVVTDRGIYRPGETISFKGIFRRVQKGALTLPVGRTKIVAQILNAKGEEQETIDLATNDFGSVAGTWSVPENASTGRYTIALRFGDEKKASTIGRVLVAEFRKPAFEVTLAPTGATVRGKHLRTRVKGRYFFGAPTRGVKVSYSIHKRPARFVPQGKGLRPYHFALEWRSRGRDEFVTSGKGRLDAKGELRIDSKLGVGNSTGPFSYSVEAEVQDIDRQTVTARRNFLVHPGEVYVGVRVVQAMPLVGKTVDVEAITVTPQGKLEKNRPVELAIYRRVYYWFWEWDADDDYRHSSEPTDKLVHKCKARPRGVTTRCSAKILSPGLYVVKAKHKDKLGNTIWASREFSVAGRGDFALAKHPYVRMELMADKNSAKPGEKVKVLVKNPFKKATLLLTVERHGVLFRRVVPMKMGMRWFELPIEASYAPNVFISAYLVSGRSTTKHDGAGRDVGAPQYRIGYTKVSVDNQANHLGVRISAERHEYHPGDALRVKLRVTDPFGRGVKSEVALAIVDESVLSLTNYKTPQPQNAMYPPAILKLFTDDSRWGRVQKLLSFVNKGYQGGGGDNDDDFEAPAPIKVRRNFVNTLLWKPQLVTDSNGELTASVKLPDNLTTYRIFAVVMDRTTRFGASEHKVVVNKPFMLRTALPRFFKQGDHVTAGVVAHNGTGTPLRVAIELRAPGIVVEGARRRTLVVPPKSSKEVAFRFQTPYLGDIPLTFIATATGGDRTYKDAVERKLPVQPTLLFQTAQNQGQFLGSTAIELRYPPGSLPEQGRLELEVSPSILSGLRDSLDYLVKYPYGCVEQTTSSTYPLLSLIELFPALGVERHARQKLAAMAKKGIDRLVSMQTSTGGLAYWPGGKHPHLYGTAYAMLALTQAKRLKIPMPKGFLPKVAHYLEKSLAKGVDQSDVRAHILYVLAMAGLPKAAYATRLFEERKLLSLFGKSLLLLALKTIGNQPLLVDRLIAEVEGEINRDGTLKHPETSRYYSYWSSNLRNQAIALTALVATKPSSAVIVPLAQAILDSRHNGYWYTTQKTTYALMSITAFSRTMESSMDAARFVAQLGERTIERSSFTKVGSSYRLSLDLKEVLARPGVSLKLRQLGDKKRLFYTLRTRFTRKPGPDRESTVLAKGGLLLYKRIEDIDGKDLTGKPVPSGALVRVRLFVYAPTTMRYLAVNDPLPAGLEALNTALSTTTRGKVGDMLQVGRYHPRRYYLERTKAYIDHSEFRDNRVLFFADKLPYRGLYEFGYLARATTRGTFVVPPATVEAMYDPKFFARSEMAQTVVK